MKMRNEEYLKILSKYPLCKEEVLDIPIRRFLDWYCYVGQN